MDVGEAKVLIEAILEIVAENDIMIEADEGIQLRHERYLSTYDADGMLYDDFNEYIDIPSTAAEKVRQEEDRKRRLEMEEHRRIEVAKKRIAQEQKGLPFP